MGHNETEWDTRRNGAHPDCVGHISLLFYPDHDKTHYIKPLFYALVVFLKKWACLSVNVLMIKIIFIRNNGIVMG
jgi:hypothetical protein